MGLLKTIIWIFLVFVAIAHFFPEEFDDGRTWLFSTIEGNTNIRLPKFTDITKDVIDSDSNIFSRGEEVNDTNVTEDG